MDNYVFAVIMSIFLYLLWDILLMIIPNAISWLKRQSLYEFFPEWRNTKKTIIWYVCWVLILLINCGFACIAFVFYNNWTAFRIINICTTLYYLIIGFIYLVVKHNLRYYYDKRKQKKNDRDKTENIRNENSENIDD